MNALRIAAFAGVAVLFGASGTFAQDQDDVASFYKGKTISLYIGSDVGGGYNAYARTVWRYLPEDVPGKPKGG